MNEQNIEQLIKDLEESKKQAEEYLNNWKRERADFVNYKKDEGKRMEDFIKFSTEGIIIELIDVIDGIEVARNNLPDRQAGLPESEELKEWTEGFDSSLDKLEEFLKKFGVEKIKVSGDKFDPLLHEAVEVQDKNGENIEEVRPGGSGAGADDHKVLYNYASICELFSSIGFDVHLLEYFDEHGQFHCNDWHPSDGLVQRSKKFDPRNTAEQLAYTSIILDAVKPADTIPSACQDVNHIFP